MALYNVLNGNLRETRAFDAQTTIFWGFTKRIQPRIPRSLGEITNSRVAGACCQEIAVRSSNNGDNDGDGDGDDVLIIRQQLRTSPSPG